MWSLRRASADMNFYPLRQDTRALGLLTKVVGLTYLVSGRCRARGRLVAGRDQPRNRTRDKPGDVDDHPRDTGRPWMRSKWSSPIPSARPCASATCS
jgi:hypothetical protein